MNTIDKAVIAGCFICLIIMINLLNYTLNNHLENSIHIQQCSPNLHQKTI